MAISSGSGIDWGTIYAGNDPAVDRIGLEPGGRVEVQELTQTGGGRERICFRLA